MPPLPDPSNPLLAAAESLVSAVFNPLSLLKPIEEPGTYHTTPDAPETVLYVYAGVRRDAKGKRSYIYLELAAPDAKPVGYDAAWYAKELYPLQIGGIARFVKTPTGVKMGGAKYVGQLDDRARIDAWAVKDATAREMLKQVAKSKVDDRLAEILAPISREYERMPSMQRSALLVRVLATIQRGAPGERGRFLSC